MLEWIQAIEDTALNVVMLVDPKDIQSPANPPNNTRSLSRKLTSFRNRSPSASAGPSSSPASKARKASAAAGIHIHLVGGVEPSG